MSKKTLYTHYTTKEQLLYEIVDEFFKSITSYNDAIINDASIDFRTKILKIFTKVATVLAGISPFFIEDISRNAPIVWIHIQNLKSQFAFQRFQSLLDEGMQKGFIRKNVNKSLAVVLYASAIETIFNPSFTRNIPQDILKDLPFSPSAIFEGVVKIIFEGIQEKSNPL